MSTDEHRAYLKGRNEARAELERAYRALHGFYHAHRQGKLLDKTTLAYHSPTIGAAARFIHEGSLDGSAYFEGKPVSVLHDALRGAGDFLEQSNRSAREP